MPTLFWQSPSGQTISVKLDATQSETHEDTVTLTDHPVERGISVTDHAKDEPVFYSVEGIVSNIPMPGQAGVNFESLDLSVAYGAPRGTEVIELDVPQPPLQPSPVQLVQAGINAIGRAITGKPKATVSGPFKRATTRVKAQFLRSGSPRNRPREVYDLLLAAKAQHALITIQSPVRDHENMMIQRIATPRSVGTGTALLFQIDLRQIQVADSETVEAPTPIEARGATKLNAGAQATSDKTANSADEEVKLESTLSKILF